jgi:hypothetical protein
LPVRNSPKISVSEPVSTPPADKGGLENGRGGGGKGGRVRGKKGRRRRKGWREGDRPMDAYQHVAGRYN